MLVMEQLRLLPAGPYMAHDDCYLWIPELIDRHVVADAAIILAYYSILPELAYFTRRRRDL